MFRNIRNNCLFRQSLKFENLFKEIGERNGRNYSEDQKVSYPKRIFSGIQPTGNVHLGNYLGAIQNWVDLQNSGEDVIWSIVDMHSITLPQDPKELKKSIFSMAATLLASGIDPKKSILFQQSTVPMHAELCWILGSITTMPRLSRLPQFKEKKGTVKDVPLALFIYPVLQAADILIYKTTHVPVGEDQIQHLELCHDLAKKFNTTFGETFPRPEAIISDDTKRIKSLRNPNVKMSKSDADPKSRLDLIDEPKDLLNKVKKSVTDFTSEVSYDPEKRPGVANLISIHSSLTGKSPEEICTEAQGIDTGRYKLILADVVIEKFKPIRERILQLLSEPQYLEQVLKEGAEKAAVIATSNLLDIREKVGFGNENLNLKIPRTLEQKRA